MTRKKLLVACSVVLILFFAGIGIHTTTPNPFSSLDIVSDSTGVLLPRLTTAQAISLGSAMGESEQSMLIYNIEEGGFYYWHQQWIPIGNSIEDAQIINEQLTIFLGDGSSLVVDISSLSDQDWVVPNTLDAPGNPSTSISRGGKVLIGDANQAPSHSLHLVGGQDLFRMQGLQESDAPVALLTIDAQGVVGTSPLSSALPVGTIITWAAEEIPEGWLPCHGQSVSQSTYPELHQALGGIYGSNGTSFNVPDYRGQFLRGWSEESNTDPDANSRTNRGDGQGGNVVGTVQLDELADHEHGLKTSQNNNPPPGQGEAAIPDGFWDCEWANSAYANTDQCDDVTPSTYSVGGAETRPVNVGVVFLIKL